MKPKYILGGVVFGIFLLSVYTAGIVYFVDKKITFSEVHETNQDYNFINPLLECNINYNYYNPNRVKDNIEKYIKKSEKSQNIYKIAYYVRLLENGSTFGYNQNTKFIPASLVKVPFAISLMRELSPTELNETIPITKLPDDTLSGDEYPDIIKLGNNYTLYELLSEMLINSDNTASLNLFEHISKIKGPQTYKKFGLGIVDFTKENSLNISVKEYASFFRILYNSSYLEREKSEELLSLLSKSTFISGIQDPIPNNIIVSNKFGAQRANAQEVFIHDCGIIYSKSPYIMCIMTHGNNRTEQLNIIQNISKMVYNSVVKLK